MKTPTQQYIPIKTIQNDVVALKDGSFAVVLQTSAVNFDLLSENEQMAIISSFAGLLNSLNFMVQIIIRSKKLDISSYIKKLQEAEIKQNNPLLLSMMQKYRNFVETIIRENEVLDKQFFVVIQVSSIELGILPDPDKNLQKALTVLIPRRDHIIRQIGRIGLKATQLSTEKLIKLFYDLYNESESILAPLAKQQEELPAKAATQARPIPAFSAATPPLQTPAVAEGAITQFSQNNPPPAPIQSGPSSSANPQLRPSINPNPTGANTPFIVEELPDDYGVII